MVILDPIVIGDENAESVKLRIEVFRTTDGQFTGQVWRLETYLIEPAYQSATHQGERWDAEICVREAGLGLDEVKESTVDRLIDTVLCSIEERFSVVIDRPDFAVRNSTTMGDQPK